MEWLFEVIAGLAEVIGSLLEVQGDRKNRNDRGKGTRSSEKYVTR
jgi:hypothetical protein